MLDISAQAFEQIAAQAFRQLPASVREGLDNLVLCVEEDSPEPGLLGLYEGIPLTERDSDYSATLPDRITLFRLPILARCSNEDDLVREITVTVMHEIAHHFGSDDAKLSDLGYD